MKPFSGLLQLGALFARARKVVTPARDTRTNAEQIYDELIHRISFDKVTKDCGAGNVQDNCLKRAFGLSATFGSYVLKVDLDEGPRMPIQILVWNGSKRPVFKQEHPIDYGAANKFNAKKSSDNLNRAARSLDQLSHIFSIMGQASSCCDSFEKMSLNLRHDKKGEIIGEISFHFKYAAEDEQPRVIVINEKMIDQFKKTPQEVLSGFQCPKDRKREYLQRVSECAHFSKPDLQFKLTHLDLDAHGPDKIVRVDRMDQGIAHPTVIRGRLGSNGEVKCFGGGDLGRVESAAISFVLNIKPSEFREAIDANKRLREHAL